MKFRELPLKGAYTIDLEKHEDDRGFFARYWCQKEFDKIGMDTSIVQINNSLSRKRGTLRGLHFQRPPKSETKILRCICGAIWDVIVDVRVNSPTYGQWFGTELNAENRIMMYVPKGFAHGFISLTDESEIIYLVTELYSSIHEDTLRWDDPFHGIEWPIEPTVLSDKDAEVEDWHEKKAVKLEIK
jgi:dTDP-4-dehydrorhamnose 3,5-epimerase